MFAIEIYRNFYQVYYRSPTVCGICLCFCIRLSFALKNNLIKDKTTNNSLIDLKLKRIVLIRCLCQLRLLIKNRNFNLLLDSVGSDKLFTASQLK